MYLHTRRPGDSPSQRTKPRLRTAAALIVLVVSLLTLSACTAGPNTAEVAQAAGFWQGLWHGIISPVTFIISLFNDNVNIYEVVNNGGWYNFGFMIGMSIIFGGGGGRRSIRSRGRSKYSTPRPSGWPLCHFLAWPGGRQPFCFLAKPGGQCPARACAP